MSIREAGELSVENEPEIDWTKMAPEPVALVLLPLSGGGTIIAYRNADNRLFGCRDVAGPNHDEIVDAWTDGAATSRLAIDDLRIKGKSASPGS